MKNINSSTNLTQHKKHFSKQRNNQSSNLKQQINFQLITNHYQSNHFHFRRYPFQSSHNSQSSLLKTTLSCKIQKMQLQNLINITHPNLINVLKIIRGQPKQHINTQFSHYFSFYYENVIYSLRRVASMTESSPIIMKNIQQINFKAILSDLTQYLFDHQIYHKISLDDIGINDSLEIKIYISPATACGIEKSIYKPMEIYRNNQNLVNWWKTTFSVAIEQQNFIDIPQRYSYYDGQKIFNSNTKSNKSSCIINQNNQDQNQQFQRCQKQKYRPLSFSIDHRYQPLTSFIQGNPKSKSKDKGQQLKHSQRTLKSHANQLQKAKIRKIHEQIQDIKKRVYKTSFDYRFRKQSDDIILKKANHKLDKNQKQIFQRAKFQAKKPLQKQYPQINNYNYQPIQQNINCINIYNQSPSKTKGVKPVMSYNIIPLANQRKVKHNSHGHIQVAEDRSNTQSNDSFHIEDGNFPEINNSYRHSLEPKQGHPLTNFRNIDKPKHSPSKLIKVTNKNVTESAGPLQFKNIINKVIKPQFLSKKSHIYEEPFEDQSEHSLAMQEPTKEIVIQDKLTQQNGEIQYLKNLIKQNMQDLKDKHANKKQRNQHLKNGKQIKLFQKDILDKKTQSNLFKKYKKMQTLNLRIKQVLVKSKNAIQLLNQAKSSKNINRICLSP